MDFVFVGDTPNKDLRVDDFRFRAVQQTGKVLFSLIDGLSQKGFGYDTVGRLASDLKTYRDFIKKNANADVFIDSGGYSIIKGDVAPEDINKAIDCYTRFLQHEKEAGDYIFSLDIPFNIKHPELNTKQAIEDANRKSLTHTMAVIEARPELLDQWYFVWHFKIREQYDIWSKLFTELSLQQRISNYAIGGLVSLRGSANIPRTAFTAMAYRCLLDFSQSGITDRPLRIHFLGVNHPQDRLLIAVLEALFNNIQHKFEVICTYDSISYANKAHNSPTSVRWCSYEAGPLTFGDAIDTPDRVAQAVYPYLKMREAFHDELEELRSGERMNDVNALVPLSVAAHLAQDAFFEQVAKYAAPSVFAATTRAKSQRVIQRMLDNIRQQSGDLFKAKFYKETAENMSLVYEMQEWWENGADRQKIEAFIGAQISEINFPATLK